MPLSSTLPESIGTTQVMIHHALIACKIELYKIEGVYPLNLELQKKLQLMHLLVNLINTLLII